MLQIFVFLGLGAALSLLGFFSYYWDSRMLPGKQSVFILLCGVGTLASQIGNMFHALSDAADEEFPIGRRSQTRSPKILD